jgi:hypothetical protein
VGGKWHTWIDYPKFHECVNAYYASGGAKTFTAYDYMAPTPEVSPRTLVMQYPLYATLFLRLLSGGSAVGSV